MKLTTEKDWQSSNFDDNSRMLSGGLLAKNTIFNLFGQILPMLVAFTTMPFIIDGLGKERFGVLTLAWMVVGYFSLFDMGLGRATTKFVAEFINRGKTDSLNQLIWASIFMLIGFGIIGTIIAVLITPWLVNDVLKIPAELLEESIVSFYLLGLSVPIVLGIAGVRGVLEALQKFKIINLIKIPTYIAAFVTPLMVLPFTDSLVPVVLLLIFSRLAGLIAYVYFCFKEIPALKKPLLPKLDFVKLLLSFGGWLTISNIIWPIMSYLDRFIIGAVLTMTAVAYYVTPYELIMKLLIISGSLLNVIFPAMSALSTGEYGKFVRLHNKAVKYLLLALVPVIFIITSLSEPFFNVWLGEDFAQNSSLILRLLALGILINAVSQVPSSAIQAMGRPDLTAKLHMLELPIYLGLLWWLINDIGIAGAAIAWVARIVIDTVLYFWLFYRLAPGEKSQHEKPKPLLLGWSAIIITTGYLISMIANIYLMIVLVTVIFGVSLFFAWRKLLDKEEILYLKSLISGRFLKSEAV